MPIVRVLRNGQITLPASIRQRLGLVEGRELIAVLDADNRIVMLALPPAVPLDELIGSIPPVEGTWDADAARAEAHLRVAERFTAEDEATRGDHERAAASRSSHA